MMVSVRPLMVRVIVLCETHSPPVFIVCDTELYDLTFAELPMPPFIISRRGCWPPKGNPEPNGDRAECPKKSSGRDLGMEEPNIRSKGELCKVDTLWNGSV